MIKRIRDRLLAQLWAPTRQHFTVTGRDQWGKLKVEPVTAVQYPIIRRSAQWLGWHGFTRWRIRYQLRRHGIARW